MNLKIKLTQKVLRNNIIEAETDFKLSEMMLEHIQGNLGLII